MITRVFLIAVLILLSSSRMIVTKAVESQYVPVNKRYPGI